LNRANSRNAVVLENYLQQKGAAALKAQGQTVPAIDPSDPDEYDRQMIEQHGWPPQYTTGQGTAQKRGDGSWFGFGGKSKQADVEGGDMLPSNQPAPNNSNFQNRAGN
jgi:hypothetical protein